MASKRFHRQFHYPLLAFDDWERSRPDMLAFAGDSGCLDSCGTVEQQDRVPLVVRDFDECLKSMARLRRVYRQLLRQGFGLLDGGALAWKIRADVVLFGGAVHGLYMKE